MSGFSVPVKNRFSVFQSTQESSPVVNGPPADTPSSCPNLKYETKRNKTRSVEKDVNQDRYQFPSLLILNAESLNQDKIAELEGYADVLKPSIIAVTEVHRQSSDHLKIKNFTEFIKLRPDDHSLGKKGGGVMLMVRDELAPQKINVPHLNEYDEILWVLVRPKRLPRSVANIAVCVFYSSPSQQASQKKRFYK